MSRPVGVGPLLRRWRESRHLSQLALALMDEPPTGWIPLTVTAAPQPNLLHLLFRPDGMRRYHVNWDTIARSMLNDVHRAMVRTRDPRLDTLLSDLLAYPGVPPSWREPDLDLIPAVALPFEMNLGGTLARFFSTVTTLGKPQDVTLEELHIETFFPADD